MMGDTRSNLESRLRERVGCNGANSEMGPLGAILTYCELLLLRLPLLRFWGQGMKWYDCKGWGHPSGVTPRSICTFFTKWVCVFGIK